MAELDNLIDVSDTTFEEKVLNAELPVLVDFWAGWCSPCMKLKPVFEELSADYKGKVLFAKYEVTEARGEKWKPAAKTYGVMSIPTLILFTEGKPASRFTMDSNDYLKKEVLDAKVKSMLED